MKQIWITRAGPPEVLEVREAAAPTARTGEVRIQVEAAGVNFADVLGRMGVYPDAPDIPYVPGYEVAGVVDAVAQGVPDLKEGDAVLALTRFGGYADHVCVPHKQVFKRLEWMSAEDGAALLVNYLTAYQALVVMGSLNKGERVLIHGVAGGVGLAALDISRIIGAETFGTSSPHKHDFLRERGLEHPIDYRNYDYEEVVMDLTAGEGVQLVLDPLGGKHWKKNYRLLMPTGRVVHYGISSLAPAKRRSLLDVLRGLLYTPFYSPIKLINENKGVIGFNWGRLWERMGLQRPWVEQIIRWYDEALFRPHVDRVFKFRDAADAHHYIQDRKNVGKVLLAP
ncbi:MAG: medium chain dehydrogenase/reductase family protein [Candidatus Promineifilaceae bacterium]|nr:medium chain dehydrogenase/reductase family protein [Candidatus Promineifilaceae bacterium]